MPSCVILLVVEQGDFGSYVGNASDGIVVEVCGLQVGVTLGGRTRGVPRLFSRLIGRQIEGCNGRTRRMARSLVNRLDRLSSSPGKILGIFSPPSSLFSCKPTLSSGINSLRSASNRLARLLVGTLFAISRSGLDATSNSLWG
jgi:hypothetical protein